MRRTLSFGALLTVLVVSGCNKVYWGTSTDTLAQPKAAENDAKDPEPGKTVVVKGALREALLSLQRVHFPYNSASLAPASRQALEEAARILRRYEDVQLYVDGHCDERGSDERNRRLGQERAAAVAKFLAGAGISTDRLGIHSFGKQQLLARGSGAGDHALNRRVEYRLMRGSVRLVLEQGVLLDDGGQPLTTEHAPVVEARPAATNGALTEK